MPRRIQLLPPHLANQIAAGEVVERPASVIKELLENSVDAGSGHIELEVEQGGMRLIRVRDDGCGIHRDDLPLALSSHATSKIYTGEELVAITSLGFRGEALASIASVSRFCLTSRTGGSDIGWRLDGEAPSPAAHPVGTTVEVRDLFFRTPARRKFLRSERTEFSHVEEVVKRVALSRFDVGIVLRHNRRQVRHLRPSGEGENRERRLAEVLGRPFLEHAAAVAFEAAGLRLWGWVARPPFSRSQADMQYFYLNGRIIRDKLVAHALRQAFSDALYPGRHPAYVLYLEMEPAMVDVNVHPTKHEVRFREGRLVHDFLVHTLREVLGTALPGASDGDEPWRGRRPEPAAPLSAPHDKPSPGAIRERYTAYRPSDRGPARRESHRFQDGASGPLGTPLGQVGGAYVLAENDYGLVMVDQREAWRLILLQRLKQALAGEGIRFRPLLVPAILPIGEAERARLERTGEMAATLGFDLDLVGPDALRVRQIPALLQEADVEALVREVLRALGSCESGSGAGSCPEWVLEAVARHGSLGERHLDAAAMNALLRDLERLGEQGRSAWVALDLSQVERLFRGSRSPLDSSPT